MQNYESVSGNSGYAGEYAAYENDEYAAYEENPDSEKPSPDLSGVAELICEVSERASEQASASVDFTNIAQGAQLTHGGSLLVEMSAIIAQCTELQQQNMEVDMDSMNTDNNISRQAKEYSSDIQNALTAATAAGTKTNVTLTDDQMTELTSFCEQNGVTIGGQSFSDWEASNEITGDILTQQEAGDLAAGLNATSQGSADSSQQLATALQVSNGYYNGFNTLNSTFKKDWTDTLASIFRNV
jgi:hypothetical protein